MSVDRLRPLSAEVASLLEAERAVPAPPPGAQARVLARLEGTLGLVGAARPDPAPTPPAAGKLAALGKPLAGLGVAVVVAGGVWLATRRSAPAPVPRLPAAVEVAPAPASAPALAPAGPAPIAAPAVTPAARPPREDRDRALREERALVERGRAALLRGDAAGALAALEQHRRRFGAGRLAEEREVIAIQALVRSGDRAAAEARARRFRARYPASIQLPVVEAALGAR